MIHTFQALVVRVSDDKNYARAIEELSIDDLPYNERVSRGDPIKFTK